MVVCGRILTNNVSKVDSLIICEEAMDIRATQLRLLQVVGTNPVLNIGVDIDFVSCRSRPTLPPHLRTGQHSGALSFFLQHTIQTQLQVCGISMERE